MILSQIKIIRLNLLCCQSKWNKTYIQLIHYYVDMYGDCWISLYVQVFALYVIAVWHMNQLFCKYKSITDKYQSYTSLLFACFVFMIFFAFPSVWILSLKSGYRFLFYPVSKIIANVDISLTNYANLSKIDNILQKDSVLRNCWPN